jgi:hypothetical protein
MGAESSQAMHIGFAAGVTSLGVGGSERGLADVVSLCTSFWLLTARSIHPILTL